MADKKISEFDNGGAIQPTDEIATNRAGVNTKVFAGSAAALDGGTSIGDAIVLEDVGGNAALPAVDGSKVLNIGARIATAATVSSGTHNVNISNGDYHKVTASGIFTFSWTMAIGQAVLVRGVNFDAYAPIDSLDWGDAGTPTWTDKNDFVVYRDVDGDYIGALIVSGVT